MPMYSDSYREERRGSGGGRSREQEGRDIEKEFFQNPKGEVSNRLGAREEGGREERAPRGGKRYEPYSREQGGGMRGWGGGGGGGGGGSRNSGDCYRCGEAGHVAR